MPSGIFTSTLCASLRVRPCAKVEVVSNKLFPKIEGFCGELLEVRVNENLMWKILKVNGEWGTGRLEEEKGKSPYFIQTFEHPNIQIFSQLELPEVVRADRNK